MFAFQGGPEEAIQFDAVSIAANQTSDSLGALYAAMQTMAKVAASRIADSAPFVSTPSVARDMMNIVNASGSDKLQFWGFS